MTAFSVASCLATGSLVADAAARVAVAAAALIATGNGLSALLLARLGAGQNSTKGFFGAIFGGMVLRMATTLGGLLLGIKLLYLPAAPMAVALLAYTALFTAVEVAQWSRQDFSPRVQPS